MADKNQKHDRYLGIFNKIDHIERRIMEIKEHIAQIKSAHPSITEEEVCLDELESEKALLEMVNVVAIDTIADTEPYGSA
ncbi:MAG: hypothetical protein HOJ16_05205 [Candidatus Peribacter sp.]|jgi:regulator of replication initiation timing|nr:hypothetical protein [Candidatus Peribacter sp.]MBT7338350.1 hypothetical protein [Candidatus Jacksonbacteria bacterium]